MVLTLPFNVSATSLVPSPLRSKRKILCLPSAGLDKPASADRLHAGGLPDPFQTRQSGKKKMGDDNIGALLSKDVERTLCEIDGQGDSRSRRAFDQLFHAVQSDGTVFNAMIFFKAPSPTTLCARVICARSHRPT